MHNFSDLFDKVLYMFQTGLLCVSASMVRILTTLAGSQQN